VNYPGYAQVTASGQNSYTWAPGTSDVRALQKAGTSDRIAATWYAESFFDIDINLIDGQTHQVAVYCLDWDLANRSERIDVLNAVNNAVLDTRNVTTFTNGQYLIWNLSGHVKLRVTRTGGSNSVVSGLFFQTTGSPTPTPTPIQGGTVASFVSLDSVTQGSWRGIYGADGYQVVNNAVNYPGYAQVTASGQNSYTWAPGTSDVRALQKAGTSDRIAATLYSESFFDIDINLIDGQTHQVAVYCLDWDLANRSERIDVLNAVNNAVLDTRNVTTFTNGQYLIWNLSGHVKLRVTRTGGSNSVVSGLFFR
jgi:hypothetical protein